MNPTASAVDYSNCKSNITTTPTNAEPNKPDFIETLLYPYDPHDHGSAGRRRLDDLLLRNQTATDENVTHGEIANHINHHNDDDDHNNNDGNGNDGNDNCSLGDFPTYMSSPTSRTTMSTMARRTSSSLSTSSMFDKSNNTNNNTNSNNIGINDDDYNSSNYNSSGDSRQCFYWSLEELQSRYLCDNSNNKKSTRSSKTNIQGRNNNGSDTVGGGGRSTFVPSNNSSSSLSASTSLYLTRRIRFSDRIEYIGPNGYEDYKNDRDDDAYSDLHDDPRWYTHDEIMSFLKDVLKLSLLAERYLLYRRYYDTFKERAKTTMIRSRPMVTKKTRRRISIRNYIQSTPCYLRQRDKIQQRLYDTVSIVQKNQSSSSSSLLLLLPSSRSSLIDKDHGQQDRHEVGGNNGGKHCHRSHHHRSHHRSHRPIVNDELLAELCSNITSPSVELAIQLGRYDSAIVVSAADTDDDGASGCGR